MLLLSRSSATACVSSRHRFDRYQPSFPMCRYFRPTEVELLIGDPTKAKEKLGWAPKTPVLEMCKEMVESDIKLVEKGDLTS